MITASPSLGGTGSPSRPGLRSQRNAFARGLHFCLRLPANFALLLIRLYQHTLSPALPALFGPACGCRFTPTCSHYAAGAIRTHGALLGLLLAAWRLVKCTPLHPGGFDPVPPRHKPFCRRADSSASAL